MSASEIDRMTVVIVFVAGSLCLFGIVLFIWLLVYGVKETIKLSKVKLDGMPRTPEEYQAFHQRMEIAEFKRYKAFYLLTCGVPLGLFAFCLVLQVILWATAKI